MSEGTTPRSILIAEDDKPMASALQGKLTRAGFSVTVVSNGEEALEQIKQKTFDLIISDLVMPRKNGFDLIRDIRALGNQVPIIVSSNLNQEEDLKKIMELGANGYFSKADTTISQVVERVRQIFEIQS